MKKRALSLLFASICAAACLSGGCGGESSGSIIILDGKTDKPKSATLKVYGHRNDRYSLSVIEDALQRFMSENPLGATYESAAEINYWQALDRRYETDNLDDIFMVERDRLLSMTKDGVLADLADTVNINIFNDLARSQIFGVDGAIYSVPTAISTYGLYINYDLLEEHAQSVPTNLSSFTAVCDYFVSKGITPVVCNNYSSLRSLILAKGMYETYRSDDTEAELAKFNSDPTLLSESLNGGIDFIYEMIANGWIDLDEAALTGQGTKDLELFASNERPFMITGGWASDTLKELIDLNGFSYGVHAYPILESTSVLVATVDSLSVKKGENEKEAKKLLSSLTDAATIITLNENQSRFSPLNVTLIDADPAIIPSANFLFTKGKYVIGADNNLKVPLDGFLNECTDLMLYKNADAATVKAHLYDLLSEFKGVGK